MPHFLLIPDDIPAGREIWCWKGAQNVVVFVLNACNRCAADFVEVEPAKIACHTDRNAGIRRYEDIREGCRQEGRLLHAAVVVIYKIDCITIDITEQLRAYRVQLCFGIARRGISHIAGINLAEIALGIDKRHQQRLIAPRQAHHCFINRAVAMRVEFHGRAHNICRFCAVAAQQAHIVHRIKQLAVGGLKAVNLRDRARNNYAHCIGHIVFAQRVRNPGV